MSRLVGIACVVALALAGCEIAPGRPRPGMLESAPSDVMAFDTLYARNCAGCHGASGRLGAARPLNDPVYLALVPRDRMRDVIANGVPGTAQPAFALTAGGPLTDRQIDVLVNGMRDRWSRPGSVDGGTLPAYDGSREPGQADRGGVVFDAVCAGCHRDEGRRGANVGRVTDPSYLALVSPQHLRTTIIAGRSDLGMPDWRGNGGSPLTSQQVADVVAWLVAQRQPVPGRLP